ncbi:MAG TPA: DUF6049 family protein, partial [Actinomycetota bacterium]|nr:DUF6049 family protein [Actinomycetota bacterium]
MSLRLRSTPWAGLALAVLLAVQLLRPSGAAAQSSEVSLTLVQQPPWHEAADALGLKLLIENDSERALKGFALRLFAYDRVGSRTALQESFDERPSALIGGEDRFFLNRNVGPGSERAVRVSLPLEDLGFSEDDPSGVYPLEVSLEGIPPETPLDSVMTQVIFYPHSPEARLNVVPVLPISALPARSPEGVFAADPITGTWPLEEAVALRGWLRDLLNQLEKHPGLHFGLAPTPRLIEELADMRDGYVREDGERRTEVRAGTGPAEDAGKVLDKLRSLVGQSRVQPLLVPYAAPDLPTTASGSTNLMRLRQWKEGADVLSDVVGLTPRASGASWLYPPGGRLDSTALEILQQDQAVGDAAVKTFFSPGSVESADPSTGGCPRAPVTFACPLRVRTGEGAAQGFLADRILQKRFVALARDPG